MKTQTINGKQYQECDVVMLETSKTNNLNDIVLNPDKTRLATLNPLTVDSKQPCTNQHLYILSNDEIKEGDWYLDLKLNELFSKSNPQISNIEWQKKVIATTDTSLEINISRPLSVTRLLPQIPTTFIQQYIDAYNNGNVIEKCFVEVESKFGYKDKISNNTYGYDFHKYFKLKLNENNEISILLPTVEKQMFSREEVKVLIHGFSKVFLALVETNEVQKNINNWIEQNLK